jgi:LacI family gluconate utilization system Gnt-I transcriptional repressor
MGRSAVTMVTAAIEGNHPPDPVVDLGFQLMIRQSSSARRV